MSRTRASARARSRLSPPHPPDPDRQAPSFRRLTPSSEAASRWGRANRKRDTAPELLLRSSLWRIGLRFRVHRGDLPGNPDIVLPRHHAVIFCDGDFWHGRHWAKRKTKLEHGANAGYWVAKIERNRRRDRARVRDLRKLGWRVIRVWESDVMRNPERAASWVKLQLERLAL